ncbi:glycoside hydrolase [Mycena rosella]|uniref:Glycoside hydrolase n=1 Tax=Mycena rosella TaxID=1033263 RepID=A0AAD7GBX3_MYCRO|nr:glycoside hydrolase [Mycena rosella]
MALKAIAAVLLLLCASGVASAQKAVYPHFMVGIVENYTVDDWKADMADAKAIDIDGFALNCAPSRVDSYTPKQLSNAYQAAGESDFKVFISFDFAYCQNGTYEFCSRFIYDTVLIISTLQNYSSLPGQAKYDGGAIASTFLGEFFDWAPVKAVLNVTALPNMEDPIQVTELKTSFDGAFSWYAWPTDGGNSIIPGPMTTIWDDKFVLWLTGRPYMLIADRWEQILAIQPQLVEIISWNDFGESHYISGPQPNHSDDGSSQWAAGMPHDAWRRIMKPYIAAYKAGASTPTVDADGLVYWYRPTPKDISCTNDTLPAPNGISLLTDVVFVTTMLTAPATLTVTSGSLPPVSMNINAGIVTNNFTMGVGTQTFEVNRNGAKILGGDGG